MTSSWAASCVAEAKKSKVASIRAGVGVSSTFLVYSVFFLSAGWQNKSKTESSGVERIIYPFYIAIILLRIKTAIIIFQIEVCICPTEHPTKPKPIPQLARLVQQHPT